MTCLLTKRLPQPTIAIVVTRQEHVKATCIEPGAPISAMKSINKQSVVAICGAACVFLLIVTGYLLNTHPSGYSQSLLSTSDSSLSLPEQSASASVTKEPVLPHLSDALQQISRFESYGLPTAECDKEFGPLFKEIERSATHRKNVGKVKPADLDLAWVNKPDDGFVRAMIYRQKVPAATRTLPS